jgi:hypothetical protein
MLGYFKSSFQLEGLELGPVDRILIARPITKNNSEIGILQDYFVKEYETPHSVSFDLYNDPGYWWLIIFFNEDMNSFYDWPMRTELLTEYCQEKYQDSNAIYGYINTETNKYVDLKTKQSLDDGDVELGSLYRPITNLEYETEQNNKKRYIKVPAPESLSKILEYLTKNG